MGAPSETEAGGAVAAPALSHRDLAILRAVATGTAELLAGAVPDLFLDGRCCSDQSAAHRLARTGLIIAVHGAIPGRRSRARLTAAGSRVLLAPARRAH